MKEELVPPLSILIVEDSPDAAQTLAELLILYGHSVRIASCGAEALDEVKVKSPDVVLLDIGLPEMDDPRRETQRPSKTSCPGCNHGLCTEERPGSFGTSGHPSPSGQPVDPVLLGAMLKRLAKAILPPKRSDAPHNVKAFAVNSTVFDGVCRKWWSDSEPRRETEGE